MPSLCELFAGQRGRLPYLAVRYFRPELLVVLGKFMADQVILSIFSVYVVIQPNGCPVEMRWVIVLICVNDFIGNDA